MTQPRATRKKNALHDLGYKIFLDRYAQKDMTRSTLAVGDTVIVVVNSATGQREIGKVTALDLPQVTIVLNDGEVVTRDLEHVDKPLETDPGLMMDRVAAGIAAIEATPEKQREWTGKFRWLLDDWKFVPGGRILTAAGTDQELTFYNCYVVPSPKDSREGIMTTLTQMTEIMSRGGGVGINISTLRPRHAYVKGVNGRSSGSVSWGALYSFVTGLIEQGGSRRGALMLILNDWHPDVFSFISSKRQAGQITNANISVGVSDKLMDAVKADGDWELMFPDTSDPDYDELWDGDLDTWMAAGRRTIHYRTIKARELWHAIVESAWASAEPGIWFRERSNKMANSWYFNPLISTNPCVTGDTRIFTDKGMIKAIDLFNDETEIEAVIDGRFGLEGATTPATRVFMTGTKQVYRLQTKEGYFLRATADHRMMTPHGWVELQDLQPGDKVHVLNRKGGFGQEGSLELGRVLGWLIGDGHFNETKGAILSFFGAEKEELAPTFANYVNQIVEDRTIAARSYTVSAVKVADRDEVRVSSTRLMRVAAEYGLVENKYHVPETVFQGTEEMQRGFLQALFTADGSFQDGGEKGGSIRLSSSHIDLLENVQIVLGNFGIVSRIYRNRRDAQMREMPDGHGGVKEYWCEAQHELVVTKRNMSQFADEIGFLMPYKQEALKQYLSRGKRGTYAEGFTATVESIAADGVEDVFDITEPITHSMIVNGLVTHQCGEQPLGAWSVCNLGALNLANFYDESTGDVAWDDLHQASRYATRFLDNVIDSTPYFFEQNRKTQLSERRIGLGTMGVAELMIKCKVRYGSDESVEFIEKVYKAITVAAYETSIELAAEKGSFPQFEAEKFLESGFMQQMPQDVRDKVTKHGIRNVTLLTQAPTGTTGTMVNTSTGIEPFFSWVYYRKSRLGLHEERVPIVQEWYDANPGEEKLPDYFITAMELSPEEHVKVQGSFQKWIDSAISKTCNVPNHYTVEQVSKLYEYMYELGCKGGTIYRDGSRDEQVLMLKGDDRAESEMKEVKGKKDEAPAKAEPAKTEQVATPHRVYSRPTKLSGTTVSFKTPFGTSYITMNSDEHGNPFEVFITVGKAGSDVQADAEAMGRMISLQLRTTAPHNRVEMLKLIVEQLTNIGGARPVGFGPQRVLSLPDAVARALEMHYFNEDTPQQLGLPMNGSHNPVPVKALPEPTLEIMDTAKKLPKVNHDGTISGADMCPECGTVSLVRAEGCRRCLTCDYTEC
jgi:ribonucleoside-diphosphate reductase alpha chain